MITSGVRVRLPCAARPNAVAPLAGRGMQVNTAAVPARRRRRGTRLSPLDPFFGMDMISPYLDEERIAGSLASSTRHMAIDIVEVRTGDHRLPQILRKRFSLCTHVREQTTALAVSDHDNTSPFCMKSCYQRNWCAVLDLIWGRAWSDQHDWDMLAITIQCKLMVYSCRSFAG